jgi:hypothetical protein
MNKRVFPLILLLLLIPLITAQLDAGALGGELEKVEEGKEKLDEGLGKLDTAKTSISEDDFLKKEWGTIIKRNKFLSPILTSLEKAEPYISPILKYTIGIEFSLSYLFFLTLAIWICFLIFAFRIFDIFSLFSKGTSKFISLGLVVILSIFGLTKAIAEAIINVINLLEIWWVKLIVAILLIIGFVIASTTSKSLNAYIKKIKEEQAKEQSKSDMKVVKTYADALSK